MRGNLVWLAVLLATQGCSLIVSDSPGQRSDAAPVVDAPVGVPDADTRAGCVITPEQTFACEDFDGANTFTLGANRPEVGAPGFRAQGAACGALSGPSNLSFSHQYLPFGDAANLAQHLRMFVRLESSPTSGGITVLRLRRTNTNGNIAFVSVVLDQGRGIFVESRQEGQSTIMSGPRSADAQFPENEWFCLQMSVIRESVEPETAAVTVLVNGEDVSAGTVANIATGAELAQLRAGCVAASTAAEHKVSIDEVAIGPEPIACLDSL